MAVACWGVMVMDDSRVTWEASVSGVIRASLYEVDTRLLYSYRVRWEM